MQQGNNRKNGFTLIEVMIVVVIVGIIASFAVPSYVRYVRDSKRSEGQVALMSLSTQLERCFTEGFSYVGASCPTASVDSQSGYYSLSISAAATSYTLTAEPNFQDSQCGDLTLTHTGSRGSSAGNACWK
ncbi:type IV pilin protein [Marinobacterium rhizophilum]|uniref:Prepilin-type N-terminal cleavage/methylation domain-containing protein n=1 Tax=Marinobacterium rhizophilum TaxID=420402 RepID=A0ABY5HGJ9_9GAMM|nr:type IV pilin protein [Marinobacterium rhizophilum]UTW11244.1 prepilin-type N-terminal cleavage/methylation domain-containing protein [Marinobacterium rhizophilum]